MTEFERALQFVLKREGGYVDNPADTGGATNFGVIQRTYDQWRESRLEPPRPVKLIEQGEVAAIYEEDYWLRGECNLLLWPLNLAHFDSYVQHRPKQSREMLQKAINHRAGTKLTVDAMIGPKTVAASKRQDPVELARSLILERSWFYMGIVIRNRTQLEFLKGWRVRMKKLLQAVGPP